MFEKDEAFRWLALHPGCFNNQNTVLFGVTPDGQLRVKRFKIAEGFSQPIKLNEQKPGIRPFEIVLNRDRSVSTFHVVKRTGAHRLSISPELNDSYDSFDHLASPSHARHPRYSIVKEEFPQEMLRAFDKI